ncbi:hypothetical protein [Levilactobacillus suantsaiihabitans]|uniref:hypothetical protein n=1 Tax=Levilactobacillus suantsaiihabitans TaxID=2487722 RepID=UPI00107F96A0|nr:hypothetical protein [Levilactobacillus suantsaiihabitans]
MKRIDKFFLTILLLLQVNFFDLVNINGTVLASISSYSQKKLTLFVVLVYILFRQFVVKREEIVSSNCYFKVFVTVTLVSWLFVFIGTIFQFDQSLLSTFFIGYYFWILLLYFPLSEILNDWSRWGDFIKLYSIFSIVLSLSKIVASFVLAKTGVQLLYLNSTSDQKALLLGHTALGFARIPSSADFIFIGEVLLAVSLVKKVPHVKTKYSIFVFFINAGYLIFVSQTRGYIVLLFVLSCIVVLFNLKRTNNVAIIYFVVVLLSVPIIIGFYATLAKLFYSDSSRSISLDIRQSAINYYLSNLGLNGWFSMGFARDDIFGGLIHDTHINGAGQILSYNFDDSGVVGFLGRFGIVGVLDLLIGLISIIIVYVKSRFKFLSLFPLLAIIGMSISLSLFDPQRIFYFPILMVLLDFLASDRSTNAINDLGTVAYKRRK